ncbi:MAG: hypothetical protein WCY05_03705 [Candidatus Omnitrophota bacterium]
MSDKKQMLIRAYQQAGHGFLAYRLEKCFRLLKTPEDIALHNDMVEEIFEMLGTENKWIELINKMADSTFESPKRKMLKRFSQWIVTIANKSDGKSKEKK